MPWPTSRYHWPRPVAGSMPANCHKRSSAAWVPLRSPRLIKGARAAAMRLSAATASPSPVMRAGSAAGPVITKSLNITCRRGPPKPSATKRSSATRSCTKTTSASPRRPISRAWPLPKATTRTVIPVSRVKNGRIWPNSPDCSVLVVEASVMLRCCANAGCVTAASSKGKSPRLAMCITKPFALTTPVRRAKRRARSLKRAG